ncbi:MAG: hypothetical protein ACRD59_10410 [Candidatus Acidiferrales bacterium]
MTSAKLRTRQLAAKSRRLPWTTRELEDWLLHLNKVAAAEKRALDSLQESLFYLYRRYGTMATLWVARVSAIVSFIDRHRARLVRDRQITRTADADVLSASLKQALATLPITNPATGFSYKRVQAHIRNSSRRHPA